MRLSSTVFEILSLIFPKILSANFRGEGDRPPTTLGVRKLVTGLSLRDVTFIRFDTIPACDIQAHRHTDTRRWLIPVHS